MKTKLFFSFLAVILIALVSNFIFRYLIEKDFEDYVKGSREDELYWVLAAVEGSYENEKWNMSVLTDALHWGMMLGFDIQVIDNEENELLNSHDVMARLGENMRRRMESIIDMSAKKGDFEEYPLFVMGKEIGILKVREVLRKGNLAEKEIVFKKRGKEFLIISFIIAGGGAVFLSIVFSIFLTKPLRRLKIATDKIARGDFGIKVDITSRDEIGNLSRSFNFMSEALRKEDMIRRHLTSNIAHELRTPLSIMKANLEGIIDGVVECSKSQVESLKEEVDRLIMLVEGIENITRAEASFLKKEITGNVNLRSLIQKNIASVKKIADERNVEIKLVRNMDLEVATDYEKINRITNNLVVNALKFTENGEVSINFGINRDSFFIKVSDSGRGINRQEMDHIFERFYKGRESGGMGIGLSIVKELVNALNGEIDVQSEPGRGSTFTVSIPISKE